MEVVPLTGKTFCLCFEAMMNCIKREFRNDCYVAQQYKMDIEFCLFQPVQLLANAFLNLTTLKVFFDAIV